MSNYKLSGNAYTNIREDFDMSHEDAHKFAATIDKNYKNGGGFGYICIPKPQTTGQVESNFDQSTDVECRYAFISSKLIERDSSSNKALNARDFQGEHYYVFNSLNNTKVNSGALDSYNTSLNL